MVHGQGLGSDLLYLTTLNGYLINWQAFTLFVNEPCLGQDSPKLAQKGAKISPRWGKLGQDGPRLLRLLKENPKQG